VRREGSKGAAAQPARTPIDVDGAVEVGARLQHPERGAAPQGGVRPISMNRTCRSAGGLRAGEHGRIMGRAGHRKSSGSRDAPTALVETKQPRRWRRITMGRSRVFTPALIIVHSYPAGRAFPRRAAV
jgi:hypothetical protein